MMRKTIMRFMALFLLISFSGCGQKTDNKEYINDDYLQLPLFQKSMKNGKFQTTDTDVRIMVSSAACKIGDQTFDPAWLICDELEPEEVCGKELVFDWKVLLEKGENFEYRVSDKSKSMETILFGEITKETVKRVFDQLICKAQVPSYFWVMNIKEEEGIVESDHVIISFHAEDAEYTIRIDGYDENGVWVRIHCEEKNDEKIITKMYGYFEGMTIQECMKEIQK